MEDKVRVKEVKVLSDDWYTLKKTTFDFRRKDVDPGKPSAVKHTIEETEPRFFFFAENERRFFSPDNFDSQHLSTAARMECSLRLAPDSWRMKNQQRRSAGSARKKLGIT